MSSVSARNSPGSPKTNKEILSSKNSLPPFLVGVHIDDEVPQYSGNMISRTNSESSLFSHISSVSEHYEKLNAAEEKQEEEAQKKRGAALKRRAPVKAKAKEKQEPLMDDNELSSLKKATEEAAETATTKGRANLKRRNSDMSSSSSSSSAAAVKPATARLKASLEQLPPTLGSSDQEIRLTRSKLKSIIEQPAPVVVSARSTLRSTALRGSNKRLEIVEESEDAASPAKMSIHNLRKHDAAMEGLASKEGIGNIIFFIKK